MKVECHSSTMVRFNTLRQGEVFTFDDCIYMKMGDICGYNAVDLEDGAVAVMEDGELVRAVEAKVVYEE